MRRLLYIIGLAIPVTVIIYLVAELLHPDLEGLPKDELDYSQKIPGEYLNVLRLDTGCCRADSDKIRFLNSTTGKYRNTVSSFLVSNKYYLEVYKMDEFFNHSLLSSLQVSRSNTREYSYSTPYSSDDMTDLQVWYKLTKPEKPENIRLKINGDSTRQIILNDSIGYYYSKCRNFSLNLNPAHKSDVFGLCDDKIYKGVPLEFLFLKRHHELFLLTLSSHFHETPLNEKLLYKLVFDRGL